ncbi:MAG TPA: 23S rRNA (guanosine(2251)-2'-O)-methyltransferase RlmB [Frankiaceae bacterium]|jgi:23S rRNA (guanosine2251-2'-O)-methyltransferase|nr:23S rRNA (guanosine(2251)-2'-O)-methyltransferase RlmB [Frankiaceae bacterium]
MPGKGAAKGTGGYGRRKLAGKGPTPAASERPGHPAQRRAAAAARRAVGQTSGRSGGPRRGEGKASDEVVVGRNPVVEALRAAVPATRLLIVAGPGDARIAEARRLAALQGIPIADVPPGDLERLSGGAPHQGIGLAVPPYEYAHPEDLIPATGSTKPALIVALDGVTDPRNLGSVVRSAAAFGAHGVVVPERRAAGVSASAWKASAGALARLRVARATNLARTLTAYDKAGLTIVGLAADGPITLSDLTAAVDPMVLVIGSEGRGLSRLVAEACRVRVRIPMAGPVESLNAGVAAGVALAEIASRRV